MSYKVIVTANFKRSFKRVLKKDSTAKETLASLVEELEVNPAMGQPIGNDCYKIRFPLFNKGKSGSARLIVFFVSKENEVYLVTIYLKSEKATMTDKEIKSLIQTYCI